MLAVGRSLIFGTRPELKILKIASSAWGSINIHGHLDNFLLPPVLKHWSEMDTDEEPAGLLSLDDNLISFICAKMKIGDVCSVACCCRQLQMAVRRQDNLWRRFLLDLLPYTPDCLPLNPPGGLWFSVARHWCTSLQFPSNQVRTTRRTSG